MQQKILLIDDEADILQVLATVLEMEGYSTLTAQDGREGLKKYDLYKPDLVITDMKMPQATGLDVIQGIKEHPEPVEVIVLTGHSNELTAIECLRAGAYDYLLKPLEDLELLLVAVRRALEKRRLDQENKLLLKQLEALATTDPLTELCNLRALIQQLEQEVDRARRYCHRLGVVLIDLDFFKRINDTHGHPFGDFVLQKIGALLRECCRSTDTAFRHGGEEFCILLPETGREGVDQVIHRLLSLVRQTPFTKGQITVFLTLSIGAALFPDHGDSPESLVAEADMALYQAKENGRNCSWWA